MPSKPWTSKADFETWAWVGADLEAEAGSVKIAAGYASAVGTSPAHECANWLGWRPVVVRGNRPVGCTYYLRFKSADTEAGLVAAEWSEYVNGVDDAGTIVFDRTVWVLNNPTWNVGPWEQLEVTIVRD